MLALCVPAAYSWCDQDEEEDEKDAGLVWQGATMTASGRLEASQILQDGCKERVFDSEKPHQLNANQQHAHLIKIKAQTSFGSSTSAACSPPCTSWPSSSSSFHHSPKALVVRITPSILLFKQTPCYYACPRRNAHSFEWPPQCVHKLSLDSFPLDVWSSLFWSKCVSFSFIDVMMYIVCRCG